MRPISSEIAIIAELCQYTPAGWHLGLLALTYILMQARYEKGAHADRNRNNCVRRSRFAAIACGFAARIRPCQLQHPHVCWVKAHPGG